MRSVSGPDSDADAAVWAALGLTDPSALGAGAGLLPPAAARSARAEPAAWDAAVAVSCRDVRGVYAEAVELDRKRDSYLSALEDAESELRRLAERVGGAVGEVDKVRGRVEGGVEWSVAAEAARAHVEAFVEEIALDPALVRHVVDGKVGERRYELCLQALSKKVALFDMADSKQVKACTELNVYVKMLVQTAVRKVRDFLIDKIALLKRPNTNVNIVKESVLSKHRALVEFIEEHAPAVFLEVKAAYVDTMSRTYFVLFKKYAAGLLAMKQYLPSERADTLVGSLMEAGSAPSPARTFTGLFMSGSSESGNGAGGEAGTRGQDASTGSGAGVGQFALGDRLDALREVEGPAIVLAVAVDNKQRFFYEQIHRSLGKMLSETCASEHMFCKQFFGESDGRMFNVFFRRIVGFLLDAVAAHTAPTRDTIGVLLALKVNDAQRSSMQQRNILDLSDYFIRVDILLKPKFKKLFDANVASMAAAAQTTSRAAARGDRDTSPHVVTRRYAEFSASVLAIARFGTPDDSILEGLRRLRGEYNGFLNAISALFTRPKLRYIFLINNIDLILSMYYQHNITADTDDHRFFAELQVAHTAAYVEHEVADHWPDMVSFVRDYERCIKSPRASASAPATRRLFPSNDRVKAVLCQFAANWRLGVEHMQEGVLREFPNYKVGAELLRSLFARLLAYHKRCEAAIDTQYPTLKVELVTSTEIVYELRQRTQQQV